MHFKAKVPWEMGYGDKKSAHIPPCTDLTLETKVREIYEDVDEDDEDLVRGTVLYTTLEEGNCDENAGGGFFLAGDKANTFHVEYSMNVIKEDGEEMMIGKVPFDDDDYPYRFRSGETNHVIMGWDLMFDSMCVGEKRRSVVPHTQTFDENKVPEHMQDIIGPMDDIIFIFRMLDMDQSLTTLEEMRFEQEQQQNAPDVPSEQQEMASGFGGGEM